MVKIREKNGGCGTGEIYVDLAVISLKHGGLPVCSHVYDLGLRPGLSHIGGERDGNAVLAYLLFIRVLCAEGGNGNDPAVIKNAGIGPLSIPAGDLTLSQCKAIQRELTAWTLNVKSTLGFDQAQVTCGGAELKDFETETLESRRIPGLFAAGEVLDVDGDCGGFNLHWAWASANLCVQEILNRTR